MFHLIVVLVSRPGLLLIEILPQLTSFAPFNLIDVQDLNYSNTLCQPKCRSLMKHDDSQSLLPIKLSFSLTRSQLGRARQS